MLFAVLFDTTDNYLFIYYNLYFNCYTVIHSRLVANVSRLAAVAEGQQLGVSYSPSLFRRGGLLLYVLVVFGTAWVLLAAKMLLIKG